MQHKRYKQLLVLSEQQLLECEDSKFNKGCSGGSRPDALGYAASKGLIEAKYYSYTAERRSCKFRVIDLHSKFYIGGYERLPGLDLHQSMVEYLGRKDLPISVGEQQCLEPIAHHAQACQYYDFRPSSNQGLG